MGYQTGDNNFGYGVHTTSYSSNVSRTATSAADLFTIPAYSIVKQVTILGPASDAGTDATISLGSDGGGGSDLLADYEVKDNADVAIPSSFNWDFAAQDPNPVTITATYAENGSASTVGGPWKVIVDVIGQSKSEEG